MYLTQGIHRAARLTPGKTALVCADRSWTWREFADEVARLAAVLAARGIGADDRVAVVSENTGHQVLCNYATLWLGAIWVPLNTRWSAAEQQFALADCRPSLLLADAVHAEQATILAVETGVPLMSIAAGSAQAESAVPHLPTLARDAEPVADCRRGGAALAAIFYTGGTTGRSKGVMLSHDNLGFNALTGMVNMNIREHTVHLHTAALFHVAGGSRIYTVTMAGGTHVMLARFEARSFLETIRTHGVTITVVVPTMLARLVQEPDLEDFDLSSLELLCYGSSPMPEALLRQVRQRLPAVGLLQSYGMTELSPVATVLGPQYHVFDGAAAGRLRSAGRPVFNVDVAVVGVDDAPLPDGEIGEVVVRGPNVMVGYWELPELSAQALRGGWMHTGDAGYIDPDGFLFLVDRVKDMIVSGGENVYSVEVENALHMHPDVLECAVIGVPSENWGESVHAVIVPRPGSGLDQATLNAHCRTLIAGYKCPRSYAFRDEELPKSGPGKILKTELRAPHWAGRERSVN